VYGEIFLISLAGVLLGAWLLCRWFGSLRSKNKLKIFREGFFLFLFIFVGLFLASTFIPCFNLFQPALCRGPSPEKWIALTFDDGPNEPYTSRILEILKRHQVPATFFLIGKNVERFPEVVQRISQEGFLIGNHTYDHRPLLLMGPTEIKKEVEDWEKVVPPLISPSYFKLFRAPHGWKPPFLKSVLKEKGYRLIGWTRGVWDTDRPEANVLFERLTNHVQNGEILLLHDGVDTREGVDRSSLVEVLPRVIEYYRSQGFRFVSLPEMIERL